MSEIRDLRAAVGGGHGPGPVKIRCVFHPDETPSLAVWPDGAFCFGGCGAISPARLLAALNMDAESLPIFKGELRSIRGKGANQYAGMYAPPSRALIDLWHDTLMHGPRKNRLRWLLDRGLTRETIKAARIGHDGASFTIPVLSGCRVLGVKKRRDDRYSDPDAAKYTAPHGQPALLYRPKPRQGPVIVCEGELDALTVSQYGYDGVTTTAGAAHLPSMLKRWGMRGPGLLVATDRDAAGDAAYAAILDTVDAEALRITWPQGKDISEALMRFAEGMRGDALRSWVRKAKGDECRKSDG